MTLFLSLVLAACSQNASDTGKGPGGNDTSGGGGGGGGGSGSDDWCAVQSVFNDQCVMCHSASGHSGDLDLETDPYGAIVGVASGQSSMKLVEAGNSTQSYLYLKMTGDASITGDVMPPAGTLEATLTGAVKTWIDNGASSECGSPDTDTATGTYHPPGYDDAGQHGIEAKFQVQDCQSCHGESLDGGDVGVSCDSCHDGGSAWRTDCTFCHGGGDNSTGAPPENIDDSSTGLAFAEHTAHVESDLHPDYDCVQCHTKPTDIFSNGHLFTGDSSAGVAEEAFTAGLSPSGSYSAGSCSNLYCHGNGQSGKTGSAESGKTYGCTDCHGGASNGGRGMSGEHGEHIDEGVDCDECHALTASGNTSIKGPDYHVNGTIDTSFPSGMSYDAAKGTCTGNCHGENHNGRNWNGGGGGND